MACISNSSRGSNINTTDSSEYINKRNSNDVWEFGESININDLDKLKCRYVAIGIVGVCVQLNNILR